MTSYYWRIFICTTACYRELTVLQYGIDVLQEKTFFWYNIKIEERQYLCSIDIIPNIQENINLLIGGSCSEL